MLLPAMYEPAMQVVPENTQSMVLVSCNVGAIRVTVAVAPVVLEVAVFGATGATTQAAEQLMVAVLLYLPVVPVPGLYTIRFCAVLLPAVAVNVTAIWPPAGIVVPDGNVQVTISLLIVAGVAGGATAAVTPESGAPLTVTALVAT